MHVLIAPNAFKNSLSATDAADAIQQGLLQSRLNHTSYCFPIADGGDGTGQLIIEKRNGQIIYKEVHDPLGRLVMSQFGLTDDGKTAIIEMADASGLRLLKREELNPLQASSFGTGELIKFALDEGVNKIIIAMGGSATVDGGCGMLSALGLQFFNADGEVLLANPANLSWMVKADTSRIDQRIFNCEVVVLCDVNNKLLGEQGAAAIFGPQKGASPKDVIALDKFLSLLDNLAEEETGVKMSELKYGGTAGGAAAGLAAFINAKLVNGIEYFLQITGFNEELNKADLLITGEGSIDLQTLQGKGPFGVAKQAKLKNIPVIGLAGKVPIERHPELDQYFDVLMAIGNGVTDLNDALKANHQNLVRSAKIVGDVLALKK